MRAVPRILELRALRWQGRTRCQNGYGTSYAAESDFCKEKVVWAQPCGAGRRLHGMGVVDWIPSRIGLITGLILGLR